MEFDFSAALLRLKQQLGVQTDKEAAELLGMSQKGFNSRKVRGSFPEDKLFALVARRPDLQIDASYVLTGQRSAALPVQSELSQGLAALLGGMALQGVDVQVASKVLAEHMQQGAKVASGRQAHYQLLQAYLGGVDDQTLQLITDVVVRIARDAAAQAQTKAAPKA